MVCLADPPKWLPVLPVQEDVAARKPRPQKIIQK